MNESSTKKSQLIVFDDAGKIDALKFEQHDNDISITFSDDGIGLAEPASDHLSLGLSAMKKYAALINGSIDFTNNESGGFKMHLTFNVQSAPSV